MVEKNLGNAVLCCLVLGVFGCSTAPPRTDTTTGAAPAPSKPVLAAPEPIPEWEPPSRTGNPATYVVFGRRYYVSPSSEGYRQQGSASWYGEAFHGKSTSSGPPFDMYEVSAAHKSLPLPTYARVTHLGNGRSIIVKINDRGPFVDDRIIDLSYAAAAKLGMVEEGVAPVEVAALPPYQYLAGYGPGQPYQLAGTPGVPAGRGSGARITSARLAGASAPRPATSSASPVERTAADRRAALASAPARGAPLSLAAARPVRLEPPATQRLPAAPPARPPKPMHNAIAAAQPVKAESARPATTAATRPGKSAVAGVAAAPAAKLQTVALTRKSTTAAPHPLPAQFTPFYLQAGAFSQRANAERLQKRLTGLGYAARIDAENGRLYKVRVGPLGNTVQARRLQSALADQGINAHHVVFEKP